ncbi:outer membrane receptor protein involved in Fe transport [Hymenobacter luteus]|uniref:Outer membrane receptor protein involved in Fe transport n=2 Tax=Hymenobacter TaxID=89966 RepID=A0A7W9WDY6_9BACT|nr:MULTISPECIES: TonB-dependent receptor [Hymenobacter]MBB4603229.1 outer membrane receptor protein involved in Fe transport [Hymenobacter latericoloratus]MBB6060127.1 outer membrane receptor protein involved in Fe transport [Hymenobacter luteus]
MKPLYPSVLAALLLPPLAATHAFATRPELPASVGAAPDPAERSVSGQVLTDSGEPLPGATVFIKGSFIGTSTDQFGKFVLNANFENGPVTLVFSYVGFDSREITLQAPELALNVGLSPSATLLNETVVSASRVEENILRAPVTIDKLSTRQIEKITTPEILSGLGQLKGLDVSSASMLFTSVSTRGFNTAKSERVIQLVDYMDTQLPSLNLSPGNLVGIPELDMESIEIIHGPASALYGSNALSGVILFNSKDPFVYEGLSVRLRGGERNLLDGQVRFAKKLTDKLAFKVNASAFRANDWIADNMEATRSSANPQGSPLGYNAVNRYGEQSYTYTPLQQLPGGTSQELYGKTVYMPGFTEQQLIREDNRTSSYRAQGALSYLLRDDLKLTVEAKYAEGTATYQNISRFRVKGLGTKQYRAELKSGKGFLRLYSTEDFTGNSYELNQLGSLIQNSPLAEGSTISYAQQFYGVYNQVYSQARKAGQSVEAALATAQTAANATQLTPTDPRFGSLREKLIADQQPGRGAQQYFSSFLHDISGQRTFRLSDVGTDLTVGAAYRQYRLGSNGLLFADRNGKRLRNYEYGGYGQLTQTLLEERLKLALAGRVDEFKNFKPAFSPRASVVYSLGQNKQHNFRASYGRAFRSPSQTEQYLYSDIRTGLLIGNVGNGFQGYNLALFNSPQLLTAAQSNPAVLQPYEYNIAPLQLEKVNTAEIGYKGALVANLYADVSYYRSRYQDFIGAQTFVGNTDGSRPTPQQLAAGYSSAYSDQSKPTRVLYAYYNSAQEVRTQGVTAGLTYYFRKAFNLTGNYSLNVLDRSNLPEGFQTYFNTPKHKYNVGANGQVGNLTYSVNYRWVQGHLQEMPFAVGTIRDYSTTDAYLGYTVPKLGSTFQAGISNAFNANNVQVFGGPQIGRLAYLGLRFDVK